MRDTIEQALHHLPITLTDHPRLQAVWRRDGDLAIDESLAIAVGEPDPEGLDDLDREHAELTGRPLPPSLRALWSTFNGIEVGGVDISSDGVVHCRPPRELGEPELWPMTVYGDHFMLIDTELVTKEGSTPLIDPLVIGEIADSGYLLLALGGGAIGVYWQARELQDSPPVKLADDLGAFLLEWSESALRLRMLLRRASVPGWTG